jgi:hypothetical protein
VLRTVEVPADSEPALADPDINVALVTTEIERYRLSLKPSWSYQMTRRDFLELAYDLNLERYDGTAGTNLVDYDRHVLVTRLVHRFSMTNSIHADMRVHRFEPDGRTSVDTYELLAGLSHQYSEADTLKFETGARRVLQAENDETGFVVGASWRGKAANTTTSIGIERQVYPNGFGDLTETDRVRFGVARQLGPITNIAINGRGFITDPISSEATSGQDYAQVDAEWRRALDRWWSIALAYRHRWIDRELETETASSNAIFVSIGYDKPLMLQ